MYLFGNQSAPGLWCKLFSSHVILLYYIILFLLCQPFFHNLSHFSILLADPLNLVFEHVTLLLFFFIIIEYY